LYRLDRDGLLTELPVEDEWEVHGLTAEGGELLVAFRHSLTGEQAVGGYAGQSRTMLSVPYLEEVGGIERLMGNSTRLGILGSNGLGWYAKSELQRVAAPEVSFDLLFENKRIQDRTIPSGMHFIDLQVYFDGPAIPSIVQYRINEQRWRDVNLRDPTLQFAGHGNFSVELRAVHPNGVASRSRMIQFGISPPWYLNPLYQGIIIALLIAMVWGVYVLRHAQLKRTNLWLQSEVKKQTRELEAATAARTNFLAGLSHDIRNPLNGVLMIAETLTRDPPKSGDDSRLKDLTEFGVIVDRMLGEILDFSAIDQSNMPMAFIPVSISDILNSSIKQNQFSIQKALVNMSVVIAPELKEVVIKTDRNWMIKILTNLIVNALEYSESERIEVGTVCHRLTPTDVEMEITVKDWGKGIDDAEKEFVFDRFYRGESGIESGKHGTGLGLSICQEIAHAMGTHLTLTDNDPSGCCFSLKGRFERVSGAKELDREAVLQGLKGKKVLVVDDLLYNRRSIVDFFLTIGCECDQCENGREALSMLAEKQYDLALLDWDLPGIVGPEIARRHRESHPEDKVILIALTAYTDGEKKRQSEEVGMNGYISKPLTASRLAYCLANMQSTPKPQRPVGTDAVDTSELDEEISQHIRDCLIYGDQYEYENLRRCAHRLTTLALMRDNRAMQQVCRDLQVSAQEENIDEIRVGLAELQQWKLS
jgi:signal transduction histidine kinase/DNA-binding response OmpR family regulator